MKTIKCLILIEATFQRVTTYTGKLNPDLVKLHSAPQVIHQLRNVGI